MTFFFFNAMMHKIFYSLVGCCCLLSSCGEDKKDQPLFEIKTDTGIDFINSVKDSKDFNILTYRNFYNGGGVAIGDIDNDGLADVFLTANMGENKLYRNKGDWKFEDITAGAGLGDDNDWSTGVVMADINSDGWLDIYVCNAGYVDGRAPEGKLYINNGPSDSAGKRISFKESAAAYGLTNTGGYCTHIAFFDYDMDGDLDAFIINNSFIPVNTLNYANKRDLKAKDWPVADFLKGGGDRLLRNDNGKFVDVSEEAGIHGSLISFGLGVTIADVNDDLYPDVYISNDFFERDYLYINQGNGTFRDELEDFMSHTSLASMGADIGDINNDGYPDIFTTDMLPDNDYRLKTTSTFDNTDVYRYKFSQGFYHQFMQNTLQLNNGNGKFSEIAYYSGVAASDWSWGALMFDADNDGYNDIYVCNGIYHDVTDNDFVDFFANDIIQKMVMTGKKEQVDEIVNRMPSVPIANKAFHNNGNLRFTETAEKWGLAQASFSNGSAYGDLDNDGDLDLVVNNVNQKAFVYKNRAHEQFDNNYVGFRLKGNSPNTFAIGSKIIAYANGRVFTRELQPSRGFQSSVDYKQLIGLGQIRQLDSVIVIWPDRSFSKFEKPEVNTIHSWEQPLKPGGVYNPVGVKRETMLEPVPIQAEKHTEDDYIDFYYERNLPEMLSREGPMLACADVNGDGRDDFYIGGAKGQPGQLFIQSSQGFVNRPMPSFNDLSQLEDVAVLFFDADGDADQDLYIGAGGNNVPPRSKNLRHRLFKNDGQGNFDYDSTAFPPNDMNISIATAHDFDGDGDMDLFVGSRSVPYNYGVTPSSYLFQNNGNGVFTDVAAAMHPAIASPGMVTGAVWSDINGDNKKELIITGEWMATRIFSFTGKRFEELTNTRLTGLHGWWQTIAAADLNGDGRQDLVIGNMGENYYLRPDSVHPVKMWLNDFDRSGSIDQFRTRTIQGRDMPVFVKRDVTEQFPALKKRNLKNSDYANKTIQDLFDRELVDSAEVRMVNYGSSVIAWGDGRGGFIIEKLPAGLQLSSINAVLIADINGDSLPDLVTGGNKLEFPPQFGRLDASLGEIMLNRGGGKFEPVPPSRTGLSLNGKITCIKSIRGMNDLFVLVARNDQHLRLYRVKNKN